MNYYNNNVSSEHFYSSRDDLADYFSLHCAFPMAVSHLIKEAGFFTKYDITQANAFALYADDDAMANFIVNGDIVIFDRSKTSPRNARIFAFETDGQLKIRLLHLQNDGSWLLESQNPDKSLYPDILLPVHLTTDYPIQGEFIYRQGG